MTHRRSIARPLKSLLNLTALQWIQTAGLFVLIMGLRAPDNASI